MGRLAVVDAGLRAGDGGAGDAGLVFGIGWTKSESASWSSVGDVCPKATWRYGKKRKRREEAEEASLLGGGERNSLEGAPNDEGERVQGPRAQTS